MEKSDFTIKLKAIIGEFGKGVVAEKLGFHSITLARRLKHPGTWKYEEISKIDKIYAEHFETEKEV